MRPNIEYDVPSTASTMGMFFLDIFVYFLLAWYFDHIDNSNRGKSYGYFFFLDKNYWCGHKKGEVNRSVQKKHLDEININEVTKTLQQTEQRLLGGNKSGMSCNLNTINHSIASLDSEDDSNEVGIKSVLEEKLRILRSEKAEEEFEGLRILGCSKTYQIANKCCGTRDVKALKDVFEYFNKY
jgi:hypothetical protein